jgi:hypothetical protein
MFCVNASLLREGRAPDRHMGASSSLTRHRMVLEATLSEQLHGDIFI